MTAYVVIEIRTHDSNKVVKVCKKEKDAQQWASKLNNSIFGDFNYKVKKVEV